MISFRLSVLGGDLQGFPNGRRLTDDVVDIELQALEGAGVDVDSVKEVAIPYAGMQAALEQGTVDAVVPADSFYHQMVDAGFVSISNPVREYQGNMPVTVWTAKKD